jgi:hypothetical protein
MWCSSMCYDVMFSYLKKLFSICIWWEEDGGKLVENFKSLKRWKLK